MSSNNNVSSSNLGAGVNQIGDRTFITGQGIGFDTSSLVNAAVQQRERPAVRLDERIEQNLARIEGFNQLDTLGETLGDTLSNLIRTDDVLGIETNVFDQNAISARSNTSVAPTDLIDALVGNSAEAGTYELTVNQLAQAARVQSAEVADSNAALGYTGAISIGLDGGSAVTVNVAAGDSLEDIAAAINAQTGTSNVSTQILQVSEDSYRLIITAEETNQQLALSDSSGNVLSNLGVLVNQFPATDFTGWSFDGTPVTGVLGPDGSNNAVTVTDNDTGTNQSASINLAVNPAEPSQTGYFHVQKTAGGDTHFPVLSVRYADGTRGDVILNTNDGTVVARNGASSVRLVDEGAYWRAEVDVPNVTAQSSAQLEIFYATANSSNTFEAVGTGSYTVASAGLVPTSSLTSELNVLQEAQGAEIIFDGVTVTRDTNSFADLVEGVDITVTNADPNTTLTLEIGNDTDAVRTAVDDFISQYNELRTFLNQQQEVGADGSVAETAVLNGDTNAIFLQNQLSNLLSSATNTTGDIQTLRDIGITLDDENLLTVSDITAFEDQLTNNFDQFRALFETSFEADSDQVRLLSQTGASQRLNFVLDITTDGSGNVTGATANGNPVFNVTSTGTITGIEGSVYEGVTIAYVGGVDASINVTIDQGLADKLSNTLDQYTDNATGQIQTAVTDLLSENEDNAIRADRIREQAADVRDSLIERFAQLEAQVRAAEILQQQISALLGNNDDDN